MTTAKQEQPNHFKLEVEKEKKDVSSAVVRTIPSQSGKEKTENGHTLTSEQEQTADQLLADIQSAVDELLLDFQLSPVVSPEPPSPAAVYKTKVSLKLGRVLESKSLSFVCGRLKLSRKSNL